MGRLVVVVFCAGVCAQAQHLMFGFKAGGRLLDDIEGSATSESKRYVAGPSLGVELPFRFGAEVGMMYGRFGYRTSNSGLFGDFYNEGVRAHAWEFPMVAKYRLPGHVFAEVGYVPRVLTGGESHAVGVRVNFLTGNREFFSQTQEAILDTPMHGVVAGGGIEIGRGRVRWVPEVRYIHWNKPVVNFYGSHGYYVTGTLNEVHVLLGVTFR